MIAPASPITPPIARPELGLVYRVRYPRTHTGYRAPWLVLLHGIGTSEADLAGLALKQDPRLLVVLVRAPLELAPGCHAWFRTRFVAGEPRINAQEAETARQALIHFISALPQAYPIDPHQVWVAGFSQGGVMSASVALTAPLKVAGFGILSGRVLPEIAPLLGPRSELRRLSAFVTHGTLDETLPVAYARDTCHLLGTSGVQMGYREYEAGHELTDTMQDAFTEWLRIQLDTRIV